jgi:hypothetical protein
LLQEVYTQLKDIQETKQIITLNSEQKLNIEGVRNDYRNNLFYTTDQVFKDILDG